MPGALDDCAQGAHERAIVFAVVSAIEGRRDQAERGFGQPHGTFAECGKLSFDARAMAGQRSAIGAENRHQQRHAQQGGVVGFDLQRGAIVVKRSGVVIGLLAQAREVSQTVGVIGRAA